MIAVFRREWKNLFCRWGSFVFLGLFWSLTGIFMLVYNFYYGYTGFEYPLYFLSLCFAALVPVVTVPLFFEERREGVGRFLRMLPISTRDVVIGKYLAVLAFLGLVTVGMALCPVLLRMYGEVSYATAYSGVLAFLFLEWTIVSLNFFLNLMLRNRALLWIVSFLVPAVGVGIGYLARLLPEGAETVVSYASVFGAYVPFLYGMLDWRALLLWGTMAIVFAGLSIRFAERMENQEDVR